MNCQEINKTNIRFKTDGFKCNKVEQSERLRHGCMSEKIVIYSRLRAWRVEGTAGDVIPWLDTDDDRPGERDAGRFRKDAAVL